MPATWRPLLKGASGTSHCDARMLLGPFQTENLPIQRQVFKTQLGPKAGHLQGLNTRRGQKTFPPARIPQPQALPGSHREPLMIKPGKRRTENTAGSCLCNENRDPRGRGGSSWCLHRQWCPEPLQYLQGRIFLPGSHQLSQKRWVSNSQVIPTPERSSHSFSPIRSHRSKVRLSNKW